ncbi:uncharacterized protein LOC109544831 isoform X1 [Dendroctonus ponderosae]|uniref:Uncharacterized protein n=1 Tax=Dendroctonus ponderosae TaxID=77166 RepID=A0AAR5QC15_DENPD|nr:uncharacterized protein LOC109544831 isoform X1 [Dendroctonus ponderosae]
MDEADVPSSSNHSENLKLWPWDEDLPPAFDPSDGGFLSFVPPPPRPWFLEDVAPDGVTTCDLCSWAMQDGQAISFEGRESAGELGWVLTLVIVSVSSALIGAVIMIIVLHCKSRLKNSSLSETECGISMHQRQLSTRPPIHTPDDKEISTITPATFPNMPMCTNANGVWSWLARRNITSPNNLNGPPSSHVMENHYTHMEDQYNVEEALYAELDRDNPDAADGDRNNSPAYQNSAYTDTDAPTSSAPSSAYYSDLSVTTVPERAYEVVGLSTLSLDPAGDTRRPAGRLAAICESGGSSIHSDYV